MTRESSPAAVTASQHRLIALAVFVPCVAVVGLATWLTPQMGLSQALGFPGCGLKISTGWPCVTCGMTTAFTYAADGRLIDALVVQPAGAILAVLTGMLTLLSGYALVTGMSLTPIARAIARPRVVIGFLGLVLLGWIYSMGLTLWT